MKASCTNRTTAVKQPRVMGTFVSPQGQTYPAVASAVKSVAVLLDNQGAAV